MSVLLVAACLTFPVHVQASDSAQAQQEQRLADTGQPELILQPRDFATVRTWLTLTDDDRLPSSEKPILEGARRGLIPPRNRRTGFVPRVTVSTDYTDNVFLTPSNEQDDFIFSVAPGVNYMNFSRRGSVSFDYSFESAAYSNNPDLNDFFIAQSLVFLGNYDLSPNTSIGLFNFFRDTKDPVERAVVGALPPFTRVTTNSLLAYLTHRFTSVVSVDARYGNRLAFTDDPAGSDTTVNEGLGILQFRTSKRDRMGISYRYRSFRFTQAQNEDTQTAALGYEHEFSERLIGEGQLGVIQSSTGGGEQFLRASARIQGSLKDTILALDFDRDVTTTPGIGGPLLTNDLRVSALFRIQKGLQAGLEFDYVRFTTLDRSRTDIDSYDARFSLSYAMWENIWLRGKYAYRLQRTDGGNTVNNNRIILSVVAVL